MTERSRDDIKAITEALQQADAVIIGAGAGLSTAAGFTYAGERFYKYFQDFIDQYGFSDMYSAGFYPFETPEEHWAYWSRYIYINRYMDAPKPVYQNLYELVKEKERFVLTTNVDHCFQKAGFDKKQLFYTQGDYGLLQCSEPCHKATYDNEDLIREMIRAQGYEIHESSLLTLPEGKVPQRTVPSELVPRCPVCGKPMSMNLRADNTFVEDAGWRQAAERYGAFLKQYQGKKLLLLELGVGGNTPGIIKYPFWQMTAQNPKAVYACVNYREAYCPKEIEERAICIDGDIGSVLNELKTRKENRKERGRDARFENTGTAAGLFAG